MVFADEPTGSLDSLAGERVMDLLVDTARAAGTTVILVTHEARIAAYADREVVVRDGRCSTRWPSDDPTRTARLAVSGGRESLVRLVLTAIGVAIGTTLLLLAAAADPAIRAHQRHQAWQFTGQDGRDLEGAGDPLLWRLQHDVVDGRELTVLRVAGDRPDGTRAPRPGPRARARRGVRVAAAGAAPRRAPRGPAGRPVPGGTDGHRSATPTWRDPTTSWWWSAAAPV